jgi:superfamily I DNA and RNA helicase
MEFHPFEALASNSSERHVWENLKEAFRGDSGSAYFRHAIFARAGGRFREPDILLLHRELGLVCMECKGCRIENVGAILGAEWVMQNWREESETPLQQAEDQLFAVKGRYDAQRETRDLLSFHFCVALPFITRAQWREKGFDQLTGDFVLLKEDLYPTTIRDSLLRLTQNRPQRPLSEDQWARTLGVLRGELPGPTPRPIATGTPEESPARVIRSIEERIKVLDEEQQKVAFEIPDGPQRLRGLAGTGKTVLFAQRAAKIHASHPDWRVAFVFFTKSLYDQIRGLVGSCFRTMTGEAPDWRRLEILHAWGGYRNPGFYSSLARSCGQRPLTANDAKRDSDNHSPGALFDHVCLRLEKAVPLLPPLYDAILVDEGQDLPPSFYRLALGSLKEPKRLYWAYDEAQGMSSLLVPSSAAVFGQKDGKPLVDLSGRYEGGMYKSHYCRRCYRTPDVLLTVAQAVNMALLRQGGALQGITTRDAWHELGYEVEGDFRKEGAPVKIRRRPETRAHLLDADPALRGRAGQPLMLKVFGNENTEREWIARQVAEDLGRGLEPTDLLVTGIEGDYDRGHFEEMAAALRKQGVKPWIAGDDASSTDFRRAGHVTLANLFRAKGNEAWKVYVSRMHYVTRPLSWKQEDEVHKRNQALVALTRARAWCVATGQDGPVFDEIRRALEQIEQTGSLAFPAFNRRSLRRIMDEGLSVEDGDQHQEQCA